MPSVLAAAAAAAGPPAHAMPTAAGASAGVAAAKAAPGRGAQAQVGERATASVEHKGAGDNPGPTSGWAGRAAEASSSKGEDAGNKLEFSSCLSRLETVRASAPTGLLPARMCACSFAPAQRAGLVLHILCVVHDAVCVYMHAAAAQNAVRYLLAHLHMC